MKRLTVLAASTAMLVVIGTGFAYADPPGGFNNAKGLYEAPFIAEGGSEVDGSEGKVGDDGSFKVEILGDLADADMLFAVCTVSGGAESFLANTTADEDGEIKAEGAASTISGTKSEFSFRVREGSDTCSGDVRWRSGFTL